MLLSYLRQYRSALLFALVTWLSCGTVLLLSALPVTPVLYGLGLGGAAGGVMLILGYFPYARRVKLLREMDLRDSLEHLPSPGDPVEQQYQALLRQLFEAKEAASAEAQRRYEETLDYFTLWAHQIKTPISAMDLILQARPDAGELKGELFKVQQYVSMALNYLRLGEGISDFVIRECQLDDILRTAVHTYAGQFIRAKVHLEYAPVETRVLTDEKWLEFVVEQLLSNALKYAPGGTVTISMASPGLLVIADDGIGIAPEGICPGSLKRATRASMAAGCERPPALVCTSVMRSSPGWAIRSPFSPPRGRGQGSCWISGETRWKSNNTWITAGLLNFSASPQFL